MSDLIEREDAIKALYKYNFVTKEVIEREIMSIPSADTTECTCCEYRVGSECCYSDVDVKADRPRGEWIEQEDDYHHYWECSECGMGVGLDDIRNFCPNCGAKMKGADDETR